MDPVEGRRSRKRGLLLATAGLLLALTVGLGLKLFGLSRFGLKQWAFAVAVTLAVQAILWTLVHLGWHERLTWDPHFVILPSLAALGLLNLYVWVSPESRIRILMVWFVVLLFLAGLAGFREVTLLSTVMATSYVGTTTALAARGEALSMPYELSVAASFWIITVYGGVVSERLRRQRREMGALRGWLAEQALTDPLTGLPNRRQFEQALRTELARVRRHGGTCTLAMIDVDHFKQYNDALGHLAGDAVLVKLGALIRSHLRAGDVGARYGGEEFAAIMYGAGAHEALQIVERLRAMVESQPFHGRQRLPGGRLTISAGIASAPAGGNDYEELVREADEALYRAKSGGRNRVCAAEEAAVPTQGGLP